MVDYEKIKEMTCEALDRIKRDDFGKAADTEHIKNLMSIYVKALEGEAMDEEQGYSNAGGWEARGNYANSRADGMSNNRGSYSRNGGGYGNSYASRGKHYVRGHYSYDEGADMLAEKMQELLDGGNLNGTERTTIQRAMEIMQR